MTAPSVTLVVEGDTDIPFARKILVAAGLSVSKIVDSGGKAKLDPALRGYNAAARHAGFFVRGDLDQDAPCPPTLVAGLLPQPSPYMCLRISGRAVEAWALGDSEQLAKHLRIREGAVPIQPEAASDPKQTLVRLAAKSTSASVRRDMCPQKGRKRKAGSGYEASLIDFGKTSGAGGKQKNAAPV
jgi:hypothetical protein